jgi:hypothetical protein
MGKTRLLAELASIAGDRATWLEGQCHSYGGLPCWPFVEILLHWLGAEIGEPEIAIRTKARAGLGALFGDELESVFVPLAGLLRLRLDLEVTPADDGVAVAYVRWLGALAAERPLIVAVEDAQWADPPARELAESVLELTDRAPVALVLSEEPIPDPRAPRSEDGFSPSTGIARPSSARLDLRRSGGPAAERPGKRGDRPQRPHPPDRRGRGNPCTSRSSLERSSKALSSHAEGRGR